jgi:hypothetical protein
MLVGSGLRRSTASIVSIYQVGGTTKLGACLLGLACRPPTRDLSAPQP